MLLNAQVRRCWLVGLASGMCHADTLYLCICSGEVCPSARLFGELVLAALAMAAAKHDFAGKAVCAPSQEFIYWQPKRAAHAWYL